jgi:hypothetical protein
MSIVLQSSGGGSVTIQEPATASNLTATLPAATGTVMVSGNMPTFSATHNTGGDQSVSANTWTKALFETEDWDTNNNYASSRFTPTVAGYYQISSSVYAGAGVLQVRVYKNGSVWRQVGQSYIAGNASICGGTTLVYCNGSTDYVEIYASTATTSFYTGFENFWFQGVLVRAA